MKIEKRFTVAAEPDRIWAFITDPEQVAPCIPGCKEVVLLSPGRYRAVIAVQVGPIKASFAGVAEVREERPPDFAEYAIQAEEGGNASRISAVSKLAITKLAGDDCEVSCLAEVNINGRLGKFGAGVMQKIADNLGDKFADAMRVALQKQLAPSQKEQLPSKIEPKKHGLLTLVKHLIVALFGRS